MFKIFISTPLLLLFLTTDTLFAQKTTLNLDPVFELIIDGTSNVRDWEAEATTLQAEFVLHGFEGESLDNLQPEHFETLTLRIPVEDIDTDTRRLTRNIHDYLKMDVQPVITFELSEVHEIESSGSDTVVIHAEGVITAAGQSHVADMKVNVRQENNGSLRFSGNQELKMTDFDIKPPTAMLGTIRSADEITILYDIRFTR